MGIIKAKNVIYEYIRRDEEGNVEGIIKAVDDVSLDIEKGDYLNIDVTLAVTPVAPMCAGAWIWCLRLDRSISTSTLPKRQA